MFFRLLIALNALVAAGVLFFFLWGLSDGTVSSFNGGLWLALLAVTVLSFGGGNVAYAKNNRVVSAILLSILALPGIAFLFIILVLLLTNPRWN